MEHYGILHGYRFSGQTIEDIRGSNIYGGNDEKLGDIDDVIFDHATGVIRYVVVDTGGWLSSKKFIVPADRLQISKEHKDDYFVPLTKEEIESFPPYNENAVEDQRKWADYETRYRSAWSSVPSARNVAGGASTNLGRRWTNFEERLRQDRERVVGACSVCSPGVQRERKVS